MTRTAYLYMRFSSAEQAKGDSLQRQQTLASDYIARNPEKGLALDTSIGPFLDEGVSSYAGQNLRQGKALHRFLELVQNGTVAPGSVLMVESLDRLSRQEVIQSQQLLFDLLRQGISVITTSPAESREYDPKADLLTLLTSLVTMSRANEESAVKSARVRSAWKRKKAAAGEKKLTKRCPSWLRLGQDDEWEVLEEKASVVRRIFMLAETIGANSIATLLNNDGVPPLKGSDGWHNSSIMKILTSPTVYGVYQPHEKNMETKKRVPDGEPIMNYYPAIVDEATFNRTQAFRHGRRNNSAGRKGETFTNLFTGIVCCDVCGSSATLVNKGRGPKGGTYLVCSSARRGLGCKYHAVPYPVCEEGFLLESSLIDVSTLVPGANIGDVRTRLRKERAEYNGEMAAKRRTLQQMSNSVEADGGTIPQIVLVAMRRHEERIAELDSMLDANKLALFQQEAEEARAIGLFENMTALLSLLKAATGSERYLLRARFNDLLKVALQKITIGPASPIIANKIEELIRSYATDLAVAEPESVAARIASGRAFAPPIKGNLMRFAIMYKNGVLGELFIDSRNVIATRFKRPKASGDVSKDGEIALFTDELIPALGYGNFKVATPQPRGEHGKFVRRAKPQ